MEIFNSSRKDEAKCLHFWSYVDYRNGAPAVNAVPVQLVLQLLGLPVSPGL